MKLEQKIRIHLSHYPIIYAFIVGIGIVLSGVESGTQLTKSTM
jgi:hypothetical protein